VLIMEWVDGNPLDVYIGSLIAQHKAQGNLKPLADQWVRLIARLNSSDVAHGDLQHGNVIVTADGLLKLVDLDGMYVPALHGRPADEMGHVHFQHPKRAQAAFDERVDDFSSLAIYLSILALDKEPRLWAEFHDDNLIFSKSDFAEPARSKLFARLKAEPGEIARLAAVLERASVAASPAATPPLSTLVRVRPSRLPVWMRPPTVVTVQTKTREVSPPGLAVSPSMGTTRYRWWRGATLWRGPTAAREVARANTRVQAPSTARETTLIAALRPATPFTAPPFGMGVVGSSIRMTYHRPGYDCAVRISGRNRVYLSSSKQAISRGYRPCRMCNP
jgi:hypothetical protein